MSDIYQEIVAMKSRGESKPWKKAESGLKPWRKSSGSSQQPHSRGASLARHKK